MATITMAETLTERIQHFMLQKKAYEEKRNERKVRELEQRIELLKTLLQKEVIG